MCLAYQSGSTTLNDWVNRIPELSQQAPIEIPSSATVKVQAKNGYDQISFKWSENGQTQWCLTLEKTNKQNKFFVKF
ncbi:MAG: hypothetical protein U0K86_03345 [Agathobacter sp.]|nr:hypothetical protein [Agathobacter sp.]